MINEVSKTELLASAVCDRTSVLSAAEQGPTASCISEDTLVALSAAAAEEAVQLKEIAKHTAEPLILLAQSSGGFAWQSKLWILLLPPFRIC